MVFAGKPVVDGAGVAAHLGGDCLGGRCVRSVRRDDMQGGVEDGVQVKPCGPSHRLTLPVFDFSIKNGYGFSFHERRHANPAGPGGGRM